MATDDFKAKGQAKSTKPDAGGGVIRSVPVLGVVKNNIDATRAGRIDVYISDFGAPDPNAKSSWITVSYLSPFMGNTPASGGSKNTEYGSFTSNPSSYGMWYSAPDIGSTVVCIFINGDVNYGYYIGGVLTPPLLQMVPAIGTSDNVTLNSGEAGGYGGSGKLPVSNLNTNNPNAASNLNYLSAAKPVHSYSAAIYQQQGLLRDPIRGPVSSSALRETPSRVGWGVSTPGRPIFQGGYTDSTILDNLKSSPESLKIIGRRGGHTLVMDDGDVTGNDQMIRLRTSLGHQILMSDNGQTLFIIHSNGQSYIELGKEGTIDMYSTNSVNIRTQGDLNLHADNNININAKKDLNIAANNININAATDFKYRVGGNYSGYTLGKYTIKVNGAMSMAAGGEGSYASANDMYINGSKIYLNTGATSVTPAEVPLIPQTAHTDTLGDAKKGFAAAPGLLLSIVSRAPAHAPWASSGQGVDVKVSTSASAALPAAPSPAVDSTNSASSTAPATQTSPAVSSTVPGSNKLSDAINPGVASALVSSAAVGAAASAASVVNGGSGVVSGLTGQLNAAVGSLALSPDQMSSVLKPGAASLVTGLVQGGASVQSALTDNLFKGAPGAENLSSFIQNTGAQIGAQVDNFQKAQTGLTNAGLITGNESAGAIAGLVNAAATVGLKNTTAFIKNSANTLGG
jgi:hypothetical protein